MRSFLTPLRAAPGAPLILRNGRTGTIIATEVLTAFDSSARRTGLLKHDALPSGVAMVIAPTNAIHTFFMKFPIDVAFVSRNGRIVRICRAMPAWRIAASWRGYAVVEMAAGAFDASGTEPGDVMCVSAGE